MQQVMLVVVAHPDDETFGTGSIIAAAADRGVEVTVCCATRGEAGEAHGVVPGGDLAAVREDELRAAAKALGASRVVLLGYRDSDMTGAADPATLAGAPYAEVVSAVREVVDRVAPDIVVTLDPDHGDGHRDHAVIGRATLDACADRPAVPVYAYTVSRSVLAQWLSALRGVRPDSAHLDLDHQGLGRPDDEITTLLDSAHLRARREAAIALHRSQVSPFEGMPEDLLSAFLDTDRLVRLQPPWAGGEPERDIFSCVGRG
jgi:LmbE family N-acetylglucosaminyl deacetylase